MANFDRKQYPGGNVTANLWHAEEINKVLGKIDTARFVALNADDTDGLKETEFVLREAAREVIALRKLAEERAQKFDDPKISYRE